MSPFAELLYELRVERNIRQADLAAQVGIEQSQISAMENALVGPPDPTLFSRLVRALALSDKELSDLRSAAAVSDRKFLLDRNAPSEVYRMLAELQRHACQLSTAQVQKIRAILSEAKRADFSMAQTRRSRRRASGMKRRETHAFDHELGQPN